MASKGQKFSSNKRILQYFYESSDCQVLYENIPNSYSCWDENSGFDSSDDHVDGGKDDSNMCSINMSSDDMGLSIGESAC